LEIQLREKKNPMDFGKKKFKGKTHMGFGKEFLRVKNPRVLDNNF